MSAAIDVESRYSAACLVAIGFCFRWPELHWNKPDWQGLSEHAEMISKEVGAATEHDMAMPITPRKVYSIGVASEVDIAGQLTAVVTRRLDSEPPAPAGINWGKMARIAYWAGKLLLHASGLHRAMQRVTRLLAA